MVQSFALALRGSMLSVHTGDNPWPSLSCLHPHQSGSARWNWKGCWRLQRFCANAPVVSIWALSRNIVKLKARTIRYTKPSFACKLPVIVLKINLVKVSCTLHLELKWFECSCVGPRFCISHHSHHIKGDANVGWTNCSCEASIRLRRVLRLKLKPIWAIRKTKHCKAVRNTQTKLTKLTKQATELKNKPPSLQLWQLWQRSSDQSRSECLYLASGWAWYWRGPVRNGLQTAKVSLGSCRKLRVRRGCCHHLSWVVRPSCKKVAVPIPRWPRGQGFQFILRAMER